MLVLEEALGLTYDAPAVWGLTPFETRVLGMLIKVPVARSDRIIAALYADDPDCGSERSILVFISRMRRKLGIEIENIKGVGYRLPPASRERLGLN